MMYIYGLVNATTKDVFYVGKTHNPSNRFKVHLSTTAKDMKGNCFFQILQKGSDLLNSDEFKWVAFFNETVCVLRNKKVILESDGNMKHYGNINGKKLQELREKAGISRSELARFADVSSARIHQIETEEIPSRIKASTFKLIARGLGVNPKDLQTREAV